MALAIAIPVENLCAASAPAAEPPPILVELFTSEGCSSCPPADAWLEQIDAAQPAQHPMVIVLSEHVDYWDHDGWKDPWSSAQLTERQRKYGQGLGLSDVYTPQVILDGSVEVHIWMREQTKQSFEKLAKTPTIPVMIDSLVLQSGVLAGRIQADASSQKHGGDVYVAVALDRTESQVLRGENSGRSLTHVAVVRELVKIGKEEKGSSFDQTFHLNLWPGAGPGNLRVIAFVQEPGQGRVWGAAMSKSIQQQGGTGVSTASLKSDGR